ncbi:hypothetical protein ABZV24_41725 [Streptomyces sp. NPDC005251]|jgi:hypothetical protein|uniref:hypothetical protein n=1 Tax=Streptomyces sp. NPDC005251 TaxID=3157166 RepID=UPI0033A88582
MTAVSSASVATVSKSALRPASAEASVRVPGIGEVSVGAEVSRKKWSQLSVSLNPFHRF